MPTSRRNQQAEEWPEPGRISSYIGVGSTKCKEGPVCLPQAAGTPTGDEAAPTPPSEDSRRRATALLAAMVGGMALARATATPAPGLSDNILAVLREELAPLVP